MVSLLGVDLRVRGKIESTGDVRILGSVEGPVQARNVSIGLGGIVTGSLDAGRTDVDGTVVGEVDADHVRVGASGRIRGEIRYASLESVTGAQLQAHCSRRVYRQRPVPTRS
jgi:cytoskeletal protein CcmA (bactofilin family)